MIGKRGEATRGEARRREGTGVAIGEREKLCEAKVEVGVFVCFLISVLFPPPSRALCIP